MSNSRIRFYMHLIVYLYPYILKFYVQINIIFIINKTSISPNLYKLYNTDFVSKL